jgi:hypothetical protein
LFGDELLPWERQWGETARQYAAFAFYRDMGAQRSLDKAFRLQVAATPRPAPADGRAPAIWFRWSSEKHWSDRAHAYDDHVSRSMLRAREVRRREMEQAREQFEWEQQALIQAAAGELRAKLLQVARLPNTDVDQTDYAEDGVTVRMERRVKGIRLGELAALNKEWRETIATGVNGHVRVSKSGRLAEEDAAPGTASGPITAPVGMVWERYPDQEEEPPPTTEAPHV